MTNNAPTQEFLPDGRHRLVAADGTATPWAAYGQIAYLGGYVEERHTDGIADWSGRIVAEKPE